MSNIVRKIGDMINSSRRITLRKDSEMDLVNVVIGHCNHVEYAKVDVMIDDVINDLKEQGYKIIDEALCNDNVTHKVRFDKNEWRLEGEIRYVPKYRFQTSREKAEYNKNRRIREMHEATIGDFNELSQSFHNDVMRKFR